ncbi:GNAT family N-acetyltransferase [Actinocrispum wychmicini]|uniref:Acetyltransferase (GNAT) family protein n=1 Tax=Actinocrispum wychmicini TaxID=1213861 RepID=A0A4R2JKC1_9PSEU|nr:GNAT family N-acetyltransferase [Actinocrispum wychmicini]TCO56989.1 acetyltransferase (GNAT) family protein [Actinocrispum wychmicini]
MTKIRPATRADIPAVAELVARLQADPAHHIGFHGMTVAEITDEISGFRPDWHSGAAVAVGSSGALRGVLSADVNAELGRGWLYGPFVDVPSGHPAAPQAWDTNADNLFDCVRELPKLAGVEDLDLFGHVQHRQLADFARRHGFAATRPTKLFVLAGAELRSLLTQDVDKVELLDPGLHAQVGALYEQAFADRTRSTRQLLDGDHTVVVLRQGEGRLAGFAAGYARHNEYLVDYVAVEPDMRCVGVGGMVVRGLLRELDARNGAKRQAVAVVDDDNLASAGMFGRLGFQVGPQLVSYRRKP